jgi:hypothetical protein
MASATTPAATPAVTTVAAALSINTAFSLAAAMVLVAAAAIVPAAVVAVADMACETISGVSAAGASRAACRERPLDSAAPSSVTPRRANQSRSLSTARATRFCAASSDTPSDAATSRKLRPWRNRIVTALRSISPSLASAWSSEGLSFSSSSRGRFVLVVADFLGHGGGLLFVVSAAGFQGAGVGGGVTRGRDQPRRQHRGVPHAVRLARQDDEDGLGDVLGEGGVTAALPPRRRVDQVHVPPHEPREGVVRRGCDVLPQRD